MGARLNGFNYFEGLLLHHGTSCARRIHLQNLLLGFLSDCDYSYLALINCLQDIRSDWDLPGLLSTPEHARKKLAIHEIETVAKWAESPIGGDARRSLDSFTPSLEHLNGFMSVAERYYETIGLPDVRANVFLVDRLPDPYAGRSFSVLAADMGDYRNHGIEPGLYFLRDGIKPITTDYFMAHEAIHAYLGKLSPFDSCDFFEEGIADLLSVFGCIRETLGENIARNVYLTNRLTSACGLIWDSYVDGTRQALAAAMRVGTDGVIEALRQGRPGLVALEAAGEVNRVEDARDTLREFAISLLLDFPRYHVVSAEAYILAENLEDGITVSEAAARSSMAVELAHKALDELDSRAMITRRKDGLVITKAICRRYIDRGYFRYDFR